MSILGDKILKLKEVLLNRISKYGDMDVWSYIKENGIINTRYNYYDERLYPSDDKFPLGTIQLFFNYTSIVVTIYPDDNIEYEVTAQGSVSMTYFIDTLYKIIDDMDKVYMMRNLIR